MKRITKEMTVKKDVFVAFDDKEFESEDACKQYERDIITAGWNSSCKIDFDASSIGVGYEDDECYVLRVRDEKELSYLREFIRRECNYCSRTIDMHCRGKDLIVNFGADRRWCDVYDLNEVVDNIIDGCAQVKRSLAIMALEKLEK